MSKRPPLARVTITLPRPVLEAADKAAARLDRSRSWVVAEAIRRFSEGMVRKANLVVPEQTISPYDEAELGAVRIRRLQADLAKTPEERLGEAHALLELSRIVRPRAPRAQIIGFETLEDFHQWKKVRAGGG
jgi:predicted transcriptional regulator